MNPHSAAGTARAKTFCAAGAFCDVYFFGDSKLALKDFHIIEIILYTCAVYLFCWMSNIKSDFLLTFAAC